MGCGNCETCHCDKAIPVEEFADVLAPDEAHTGGWPPEHAPSLFELLSDLLADRCEEPDEVTGEILTFIASAEGTGATLEFLSNANRLGTAFINADGGPAVTPVGQDHLPSDALT